MKNVLILGGGFAGVSCALELSKIFGDGKEVTITLVDKDSHHWFHADYYEVASSLEELTDNLDLRDTVAIPFAQIFKNKNIRFVKDEVTKVDASKKQVHLKQKNALPYDYLVSALGSTACFYGIPGADEHALPLKTFYHALRVRNDLEGLVQKYRQETVKPQLRVVIVGGGFSGVELAAELVSSIDFLSWKYNYPREKIELKVLEGGSRLLAGMPDRAARDTFIRLKRLGVYVSYNSKIVSLTDNLIELDNGESMRYDLAVWTAGVKSEDCRVEQILPKDHSGRAMVSETLQSKQYHNILFMGDQSCIENCQQAPTAMNAIHQGKYAAYAVSRLLFNKKPKPYKGKTFPYIIPLGGKYAVYSSEHFYTAGYVGYLLKILRTLNYYASLVGWMSALKFIYEKQKFYSRND